MEIKCTNCGADVPIGERTAQVVCSYCHTALFAQLTKGVPHLVLQAQVDTGNLLPILQRFLAGIEINDPVPIERQSISYYPFWRFKSKGKGENYLVAASAPIAEDFADMLEPAAEAVNFAQANTGKATVIEADSLMEEAASCAQALGIVLEEDEQYNALVHVPIIEVTYKFRDVDYTAYIEGISGQVYFDKVPESPQREKSRTLGLVALVSFLLFFVQVYKVPSHLLWITFPATAVLLYFAILRLLRKLGW